MQSIATQSRSHSRSHSSHSTPAAVGTPSNSVPSPSASQSLSNSPHPSTSHNNHNQAPPSFAMDSFDFSSTDFSLPSNMDDLNLFTSQSQHSTNQIQSPGSNLRFNSSTESPGSTHHHLQQNQNQNQADSPSSNLNSIHQMRFDDLSSQEQIAAMIQSAAHPSPGATATGRNNQPSSSSSSSSPNYNLKINTNNNNNNSNLTIQDLHKILMEKEHSERMQNMQTAVLRQQLETLQQMSQKQSEQTLLNQNQFSNQHQQLGSNNQLHQQGSSQPFLPFYPQGPLGHQNQNSSNSTPNGTPIHHSFPNNTNHQTKSSSPSSDPSNYPSASGINISSSTTPASVIAQYGLMTPMGSGAFNNSVFGGRHNGSQQQPFVSPLDMPHGHGNEMDGHHMNHRWRGQEHESAFSPLESPAMTPASVFSNMSRGGGGGGDHLFFSPLTSPALRPQPPSAGEMLLNQAHFSQDGSSIQHHHHGQYDPPLPSPQFRSQGGQSTTPAASPLALMGKPGPSSSSSSRRNRSSTAEAKANKIRPSPLVKPINGRGKKKDSNPNGLNSPTTPMPNQQSSSTSNSDSRRQSTGDGINNNNDYQNSSSSSSSSSTSRSRSGSRVSSSQQQHQPQTSISAFSSQFDSNTRMDQSPSEGAISTPSPIDLSGNQLNNMPPPAAPNNKPMTPGSIMGIRSNSNSNSNGSSTTTTRGSSNLVHDSNNNNNNNSRSGNGSGNTRNTRAKSLASANNNNHNGSSSNANASNSNSTTVQPILKKPAIYTGGPAGPRAQAGGGRGKRAAKAAAAVNFANPGMTPAEREAWLNKMAGTDGDSRKTSHKAAEQKRRDSLKYCFDELRTLLPAILLDENSPGGSALGPDGTKKDCSSENFKIEDTIDKEPGSEPARTANKGISKVALLRHSNEYIIRLKMRLNRRDQFIKDQRDEIKNLKKELGRDLGDDDGSEEDDDDDFDDDDVDDVDGLDDEVEEDEIDEIDENQINFNHHHHNSDLSFEMDIS